MQRPGETVIRVDAGSAQEWLNLLVGMAPFVAVCLALGGLTAIILRRHASWACPASIIVRLTFYALLLWHSAERDAWSWNHPIASALYQIAPAAIFFVAPTLAGVSIVRWFVSRHTKTI